MIGILTYDSQCFIINLGDSRAVIGAKQGQQKVAFQMSIDHKPLREDERKRIDLCGGTVSNERNGMNGPPRIYSLNDDGPGMAVSRTIGDIFGHTVGVSADPEVSFKELDTEDKFIVIASDGVWDVMNSSEAVGFIFEKEKTSKEKIAEDLVNECRLRWEKVNDYKKRLLDLKLSNTEKKKGVSNINQVLSIDDITVIICFF
jgi:integrin-linked kinase-associated serine/threonine phosphatase 2C